MPFTAPAGAFGSTGGFNFGQVMANPMFNAGMGMLGGSMNQPGQGPQNLGQIGMLGLGSAQQAMMMNMMMQKGRQEEEERQRALDQETRRKEALAKLSDPTYTSGAKQAVMAEAFPMLAAKQHFTPPPKESGFAEKLRLGNIDPNTPEGQAFVQDVMRRPSASVNIANIPKPPTGFWYKDPADISQGIEPMTGREIPPEQAGKRAALSVGLEQVNTVRDALIGTDTQGNAKVDRQMIATMQGNVPWSTGRQKRQELEDALQAKLRAETGAAANKEEVVNILDRYIPSLLDSDNGVISKMQRLEDFFSKSIQLSDPQLYQKLMGRAEAGGSKPKPWEKQR